jgi:hypothetical protein
MDRASLVHDWRVRATGLFAAASLALCATVAGVAACITTPPPDLPDPRLVQPSVLSDTVPPTGQLLQWPTDGSFTVFVDEKDNPAQPFQWAVFVDYDDNYASNSNPSFTLLGSGPSAPDNDGGTNRVEFTLPTAPSTPFPCPHRIDFVVVNQFAMNSDRVPNSVGGDTVSWFYYPDGVAACAAAYDAGNGAFPEASFDRLPIPPPEAGGEP